MDEKNEDFGRLLHRVNAGSDPAAQKLYELFSANILRAVRRKLPRALRPKFDSIDFVQEAWAVFWEEARQKYSFDDPEQFAGFLARLAENIVVDAVRQRLGSIQRNVNREVPIQVPGTTEPRPLADDSPTPSHALMCDEEWQRFLMQQPPVYQRVFILYREGNSPTDIAEEMGISRRNVDRILTSVLQGPKTDPEQ
jgi:RNA polymerase sigma-70 factor (ECF subfamily)